MVNEVTKSYKLSRNIAKFRKSKNFSQNTLAERLNISREHLAKIETNKRNISIGLLFELCNTLGIEEKQLFDFE
ncbi:MAG: helix-turn-helix transcriptional regulator [Candidatus Gastranaerophilales bacterium]